MPKLHLKRTPEEEAHHRLRKKEKKEAKRKRRRHSTYDDTEPGTSRPTKHHRTTQGPLASEGRKWASSDEDEEQYGPQPASSTSYSAQPPRRHKPDKDELRAEMDEIRFREKMFDAFADDERLDSLEARLNDFGHVPDRWRTSSAKARFNVFEDDNWLKANPGDMDDEDYAEWIRMGMYRKTHASEYAEQQRQKAAQEALRAEEKARREETARLEKAVEEERSRKILERETRRWDYARDEYHAKWKTLLKAPNSDGGADTPTDIGFCDIPWPILHAYKGKAKQRSEELMFSVEDLTLEAISAFLMPNTAQGAEKGRKEVLRETFLRFHPDKFEGRLMKLVRASEQETVREGIGRVVRALNTLM